MLSLILIALLVVLFCWMARKPQGLPPGPWGLPLVGHIPSNISDLGEVIKKMKDQYGDIFTWRIGTRVVVVMNDFSVIKSVLSLPQCQGRPNFFTTDICTKHTNSGLLFSDGKVWQDERRFAIRHLKNFGFGKNTMEGIIEAETREILKAFDKAAGKPVEVSWFLNVAVLNVIWRIVADRHYEIDDPDIVDLIEKPATNANIMQGPAALLDVFPWLIPILPSFVKNRWMQIDTMLKNNEDYYEFFTKVIREHRATMDSSNLRDLIDVYLAAKKESPEVGAEIDDTSLVITLSDFFAAGSESTSSTTRWLILLMAIHPEVQQEAQREIDDVVPRENLPSLQDRDRLHYVNAVLHETMRYCTLTPMGLFHAATAEVDIGEYKIPKGTILAANIDGCHRDPTYWERPDQFYPRHFLDEHGHFRVKKEGFLPFSIGKRQCLGESLAKMELFLFASAILQKFTIRAPPGVTLSAERQKDKRIFNIAKPYKIVLERRS